MPTTLKNQVHQGGTAPPTSVLSAQCLASRLLVVKRKMEDSNPYDIAAVPHFSRMLAVHSAASSMQGCLRRLELPNSDVTNQCRDHFGFRHSGSGGGRTHNIFFAREAFFHWNYRPMRSLFSVKVTRAICVFSATKGTPPMSYYTLFKGWLPLSQPAGFFALLVHKRPLY